MATDPGSLATELDALSSRCALADRSDLARLVGSGPELLGLLQRLGTGDLQGLDVGAGRPTVLTTPKGRIVERLIVQRRGPAETLLVGGTGAAERVLAHLARYSFGERTELVDRTAATCLFAVIGPEAGSALEHAGLPRPAGWSVGAASLGDAPVDLLGHDGFGPDGFSILAPAA
ncbi:MAG TPA: hypothetical protein VJS92_07405, partial [Candidatus Polarisedimenticolaceae bacterium]|nr:hypothetical protein [Candidatus Polarisedimenticolaceae bacterium]